MPSAQVHMCFQILLIKLPLKFALIRSCKMSTIFYFFLYNILIVGVF